MDDGTWMRIAENLAARVSGPMKFRLVVQPITAAIFAIRSGLADATAGKPPYLGPSSPIRPPRRLDQKERVEEHRTGVPDRAGDGCRVPDRRVTLCLPGRGDHRCSGSGDRPVRDSARAGHASGSSEVPSYRPHYSRCGRDACGGDAVPDSGESGSIDHRTESVCGAASSVDVGPLRFSLLSGSLSAETLTIGDDPAFSVSPFLRANSVTIDVERWPLIAFGSLHITRIRVEHPTVTLIRHSSGQWNYSSLGSSSSASSAFPIAKLEFNDGRMVVETTTRTRTYEHVNLAASNVPMPSVWRVIANAVLPGGATFSVMGDIGPMNPVDASLTPIDATIGARMPATALESFLPELGIHLPGGSHLAAGTLVANLNVVGATNRLVATGTAGILNARLTGFDFWSKLRALSAFNGLDAGSDLDIEEMTTDLRMTEDGVRFDHLDGVITSLGHVTGVGTIDAANNLDVGMVAILTGPAGGSGVAVGTAGAVNEGQRIPFLIRGPMSDPQFVLDKSSLSIGSSP